MENGKLKVMVKKIFLLIFGISASLAIQAQSAQEFFNSVIDKTKSYQDISIVFNYSIVFEDADLNEKMNGYASIKGDSYLLNLGDQVMISNGELVWNYLIDEQEVMISEATEDNNSSPIAILNSFSQDVTASFIDSYDIYLSTIELKEKEGETFEKIQISVDSRNMTLKEIHIFNTDGSELIYDITSFTTNQNLPDNMFTFDEKLHPDVEVIDMR